MKFFKGSSSSYIIEYFESFKVSAKNSGSP